MEIFGKLFDWFIQQTNSPVVTLMLIICAGLCTLIYFMYKGHAEAVKKIEDTAKEDTRKLNDQLEKLQHLLYDKHSEEKKAILDILDKYHQSQITMTQALTGVQAVLTTLAYSGRNNGGH